MLGAALGLLLAGILAMFAAGYPYGNAMMVDLPGREPAEVARVLRERRFYLACMGLAFLGIALFIAGVALFPLMGVDAEWLPLALGVAAVHAFAGAGMLVMRVLGRVG